MRLLRTFLILATLVLGGCAATHANNPADPFESLNRGTYKFNDALDKAVVKPISKGYKAVVPQFGRTMVSNFFSNLDDVIVTINDVLQFKLAQGLSDATRFLVNSTLGIFGLFDVASTGNLVKHNEDFGQTLGKWGIGNGPYLVTPFFGPSTVRDGIGLYADSQVSLIREIEHIPTRNQVYATQAVSRRADLLDAEKILDEAAIDRYAFIRDAYLLRRKSLVYDGDPPRKKFDDDDYYSDNEAVPAAITERQEPVTVSGSSAEITQPAASASSAAVAETAVAAPASAKANSPESSPATQPPVASAVLPVQQQVVYKIWLPASR